MKKITSIVLCFVIMFASVIANSIISANGQTFGNNLLSNADTPSWVGYRWNTSIVETTDSRYGGEAILNKTVAHQNLYTAIETVPDKEYTIKFSVKVNAINRIEIFAVPKGAQIPFGSSALNSSSSTLVTYKAHKNFTTSETEWTDILVEFETVSTENVQYYMNILFGDGGTTNTATVSDFSLEEVIDEPIVPTPPQEPTEKGWQQYKFNKTIEKTADSRYGGEAILNKTIAHQNLYTAIETVPDKEYTIKFSIKANEINRIEIFAVPKGEEVPWNSSALNFSSSVLVTYTAHKNFTTLETAWTDISIEFETVSTENVQYYINILFGDGGTTNTATISDFSLEEVIDEPVVPPLEEPSNLGWQQYKHNKVIEATTDSRYGGEAILNKTVGYQNLYTSIETLPNESYTISFSVKVNAINRIEIFAVPKGEEVPWNSSALNSSSSTLVTYKAHKNFTASETEWTDILVEFETVSTENVQYYMNILFGDGGTTNTATVSDFSLVKKEKMSWFQHKFNTSITETNDSCYGGEAILNKTVAFQNLYTPLNTVPEKTYNVKFSVKANAINRIEIFALPKGTEVPWNSNSTLNFSSSDIVAYKAHKNYFTSETEWTDIVVQFETVSDENVQYYVNILFGAGGTSNTATLSDFSLAESNGEPVVTPPGKSVWQQYRWNVNIEKTTDSRYGGEAIYNKTVAYQNLYKRLDVESNATYRISFSVKTNEILHTEFFAVEKGAELTWQNSVLVRGTTLAYTSYMQTETLSTDEWTDLSYIFTVGDLVDADYYFNIHFGDGGESNDATISDFKFEKLLPGYLNETELSYCEDFYNEAFENVSASDINTKTVIAIPVQKKKIYNFGITLNGKGRAVLSFDKDGNEVIKELNANGKREGFSFLSHQELSEIYLILEPETTLSYKDLYVFVQMSVSFGTEMGKAENPNLIKAPTYLSNAEIEAFLKNSSLESDDYQSDDYQSPATGDSQNPLFAFGILVASLFLTLCLTKQKSKNTKNMEKEVV